MRPLRRRRALEPGVLMVGVVAVTCTIPDYPLRPDDADKAAAAGGEGGDSSDGVAAGGSGAGRDGSGGDGSGDDGLGGDGGHAGEPPLGCGDGERVLGEECDDGNEQSNDGCSATCQREILEIALGHEHSCALFDNGAVACWGQNSLGKLGLDHLDPEDATGNRGDAPNELGANLIGTNLGSVKVRALSLGWEFSCALLEGGSVKCWGANESGQLCAGHTLPLGGVPEEDLGDKLLPIDLGRDVVAQQISCGEQHCCAIVNANEDGGDVKCWGLNDQGQLGLGHRDNRGDDASEIGDGLRSVDLGGDHVAKSVTLGNKHTCALLDDDSVRCWGLGFDGQLGNGKDDPRGDDENEMGGALIPVNFGNGLKAKQIEAGGQHTCAILEDDSLKCWGDNQQGQLGVGDEMDRGTQPEQMGENLPAVNLGRDRHAVRVTAGEFYTCVLLDDDTVKCWGDNWAGELGQGDQDGIGRLPTQMGDHLLPVDLGVKSVLDVAAGTSHACAILDTGGVKCWGYANSGALGLGDETDNRGDAPGEMGHDLPFVPLFPK